MLQELGKTCRDELIDTKIFPIRLKDVERGGENRFDRFFSFFERFGSREESRFLIYRYLKLNMNMIN
jgi:hypothetical protein